jgi:TonB family protein
MTLLVESAVKGAAIVAIALAMMPLLRGAPAAFRHWLLSAALLCAAVTPVIVLTAPSWSLPLAGVISRPAGQAPAAASGVQTELSFPGAASAATPRSVTAIPAGRAVSLVNVFRWTWIAGAAVGVLVLLLGFVRLTGIAWRSRRITAGPWIEHAARVCDEYRIRRPLAIMEGPHPALLVTWGFRRPKLILPHAAVQWDDTRIRLVLHHELAHVRRADWLVQVAAELMRAVYWFNPTLWLACRQLRDESERACDDAVLASGVEGRDYACNLVGIARELAHPRWMAGAAIARTSKLERRVSAMLDTRLNRRPVSRRARTATLVALLAIAIPIGAVAARQTSFTTLSGSVVDPMNAALPGVTVVLTNASTQARYEVKSDRTGHYEVGGLPPGEYVLEARLPGFATLKQTLTFTGQNVDRTLTLQVGSVQETIVVRGGPDSAPAVGSPGPAPRIVQAPDDARRKRAERPCGAGPTVEGVPIGGNLGVPLKLKDVKPDYPADLRSAGVQGTVTLSGKLGADGYLHDLAPVAPAPDGLVKAAIDAAAQWEFAPTLLNCVAIDVPITITVHFRQQ